MNTITKIKREIEENKRIAQEIAQEKERLNEEFCEESVYCNHCGEDFTDWDDHKIDCNPDFRRYGGWSC